MEFTLNNPSSSSGASGDCKAVGVNQSWQTPPYREDNMWYTNQRDVPRMIAISVKHIGSHTKNRAFSLKVWDNIGIKNIATVTPADGSTGSQHNIIAIIPPGDRYALTMDTNEFTLYGWRELM